LHLPDGALAHNIDDNKTTENTGLYMFELEGARENAYLRQVTVWLFLLAVK